MALTVSLGKSTGAVKTLDGLETWDTLNDDLVVGM